MDLKMDLFWLLVVFSDLWRGDKIVLCQQKKQNNRKTPAFTFLVLGVSQTIVYQTNNTSLSTHIQTFLGTCNPKKYVVNINNQLGKFHSNMTCQNNDLILVCALYVRAHIPKLCIEIINSKAKIISPCAHMIFFVPTSQLGFLSDLKSLKFM